MVPGGPGQPVGFPFLPPFPSHANLPTFEVVPGAPPLPPGAGRVFIQGVHSREARRAAGASTGSTNT